MFRSFAYLKWWLSIAIWVNYNNSLTWNKAILGSSPIHKTSFQWRRSEVVIIVRIAMLNSPAMSRLCWLAAALDVEARNIHIDSWTRRSCAMQKGSARPNFSWCFWCLHRTMVNQSGSPPQKKQLIFLPLICLWWQNEKKKTTIQGWKLGLFTSQNGHLTNHDDNGYWNILGYTGWPTKWLIIIILYNYI